MEADVGEFGLAETVRALREELEQAVTSADGQEIRFLVGPVQLEFHVAVRREGGTSGKARFWVLEAGADVSYAKETIQKVSLTLEAASTDGQPIRVQRGLGERP